MKAVKNFDNALKGYIKAEKEMNRIGDLWDMEFDSMNIDFEEAEKIQDTPGTKLNILGEKYAAASLLVEQKYAALKPLTHSILCLGGCKEQAKEIINDTMNFYNFIKGACEKLGNKTLA